MNKPIKHEIKLTADNFSTYLIFTKVGEGHGGIGSEYRTTSTINDAKFINCKITVETGLKWVNKPKKSDIKQRVVPLALNGYCEVEEGYEEGTWNWRHNHSYKPFPPRVISAEGTIVYYDWE